MQSMLAVNGLVRRLGPGFTLGPIDLSIEARQIVCLVGHSGCGKSTLLRLIAGIERPGSGTIGLNGKILAGPDRFVEPEKRNIGFVFQDYALFPHMTIEQNILFGLRKRPRKEAQTRVAMLLELTALTAMADRYPHMLSGGEQQRAALARALAPEPSIVLMDEPFSNLDRDLRERLRHDTVALLRQTHTTAVIVTHDAEEALSIGDRIILMKSGQIIQQGSSRDLHDQPVDRYSAEFFSSFNRVPGSYRDGKLHTAIGAFPCQLDLAEGSQALAFIRPQAVCPCLSFDGLSGSVLAHSFRGEIEQFSLGVEGLEKPLVMRTTQRLTPHKGILRFRIDPQTILFFPAAGQDASNSQAA
ncbi:ABC transporter ATP-binding protein [Aquamicrobium segne]|uniref:ABC transporter ATP-binding protein n=1 Tax=Aquamicrobium segne TaxID=469547 RepID=A0ABW0GZ25_9HYPH